MAQMTFAQIGTLYNKITNELVGGVTHANQQVLLNQVATVQNQVQGLINNGTFNTADANAATALVHAQNIADQTNFLHEAIANFGTANNGVPATKIINDVQRDIQDIVAADPALSAAAHQGTPGVGNFQQVSNLLTPPTPFADNMTQDAFLIKFGQDSAALAAKAMATVGQPANSPAVTALVGEINAFSASANAFSNMQGGVFAARFNNELTTSGVQGTAVHELVAGLNTGNVNLVNAAANVLTQNAADVQGNNSFNGIDIGTGKPVVPVANGGIPATVNDIHTAGQVFDDATTKLIGGVGATNQASIVADLNATQGGLQHVINQGGIPPSELQHLSQLVSLLGNESGLVAGINTANPTPVSHTNALIHNDTQNILNIVNNDPNLHTAAAGTFQPLPPVSSPGSNVHMVGGPATADPAAVHTVASTPAPAPIPPMPVPPPTPASAPATMPGVHSIPGLTDTGMHTIQHIHIHDHLV